MKFFLGLYFFADSGRYWWVEESASVLTYLLRQLFPWISPIQKQFTSLCSPQKCMHAQNLVNACLFFAWAYEPGSDTGDKSPPPNFAKFKLMSKKALQSRKCAQFMCIYLEQFLFSALAGHDIGILNRWRNFIVLWRHFAKSAHQEVEEIKVQQPPPSPLFYDRINWLSPYLSTYDRQDVSKNTSELFLIWHISIQYEIVLPKKKYISISINITSHVFIY